MTHADMLTTARLALAFGRVERATRHPDGVRRESDAEHTIMLCWVAMDLIAAHPEWDLEVGNVLRLALVHDLPEVYAGDTDTSAGLDAGGRASKAEREAAALARLNAEMPDSVLPALVRIYERQAVASARFLRYLDKICPKLTQSMNDGAQYRADGATRERVKAAHDRQRLALRAELPEWAARLEPLFDAACLACEAVVPEAYPA